MCLPPQCQHLLSLVDVASLYKLFGRKEGKFYSSNYKTSKVQLWSKLTQYSCLVPAEYIEKTLSKILLNSFIKVLSMQLPCYLFVFFSPSVVLQHFLHIRIFHQHFGTKSSARVWAIGVGKCINFFGRVIDTDVLLLLLKGAFLYLVLFNFLLHQLVYQIITAKSETLPLPFKS